MEEKIKEWANEYHSFQYILKDILYVYNSSLIYVVLENTTIIMKDIEELAEKIKGKLDSIEVDYENKQVEVWIELSH